MPQIARPSSDVTVTSFTGTPVNTVGNRFTNIDEVSPINTDFVYGANNSSSATYTCRLTELVNPNTDNDHIVRFRYAKVAAGVLNGTGGTVNITVNLLQGTTVIASLARTTTGTWQQDSFTLTPLQASNITNYGDLRIRINQTASGGGGNARGSALSWVELEIPDVQLNFYTLNVEKATVSSTFKEVNITRAREINIENSSIGVSYRNVEFIKGYGFILSKSTTSTTLKSLNLLLDRFFDIDSSTASVNIREIGFSKGKVLIINKASVNSVFKNIVFSSDRVLSLDGAVINTSLETLNILKSNLLNLSPILIGSSLNTIGLSSDRFLGISKIGVLTTINTVDLALDRFLGVSKIDVLTNINPIDFSLSRFLGVSKTGVLTNFNNLNVTAYRVLNINPSLKTIDIHPVDITLDRFLLLNKQIVDVDLLNISLQYLQPGESILDINKVSINTNYNNLTLLYDRNFVIDNASKNINLNEITATVDRLININSTDINLNNQLLSIYHNRFLQTEPLLLDVYTNPINFSFNRPFNLDTLSYSVLDKEVMLEYLRFSQYLILDKSSFNTTFNNLDIFYETPSDISRLLYFINFNDMKLTYRRKDQQEIEKQPNCFEEIMIHSLKQLEDCNYEIPQDIPDTSTLNIVFNVETTITKGVYFNLGTNYLQLKLGAPVFSIFYVKSYPHIRYYLKKFIKFAPNGDKIFSIGRVDNFSLTNLDNDILKTNTQIKFQGNLNI
jgi:hypothetical protein